MDGVAFCRGCLSRHDEPDDLIQYTEKNRRQFVYSTGLQVKRNDSFTFQLCKACYLNMKMGCKFKKQCRASDKRFRTYIGLKEAGAAEDLASFLAKDDDMFRFPFISGGVTPSYQQAKEDDNESTNTSIRNFMTGLVQPEDLLDSEAKIVSEVIAEEADILEDSLDSLWLQEDSMDPEMNMDISFSAFSTPRVLNEDRCLTPRKIDEIITEMPMNIEDNNEQPFKFATKLPNVYADFIVAPEVEETKVAPKSITKSSVAPRKTLKSMPDLDSIITGDSEPTFKLGEKIVQLEDSVQVDMNVLRDSIDKNLKKALNDDEADAFSLSELLVSPAPSAMPHASPSPSIKSILFGHAHAADDYNNKYIPSMSPPRGKDLYQHMEPAYLKPLPKIQIIEDITTAVKSEPIDYNRDIVDDILKEASANLDFQPLKLNFYMDTQQQEIFSEQIEPSEHEKIKEKKVRKNTGKVCEICQITFGSVFEKRQHSKKFHLKIQCDKCNKKFFNKSNFKRHLWTHETKSENCICDVCQRSFAGKAKLLQHLRTHAPFENLPRESFAKYPQQVQKERVCPICDMTIKGQNYYTHVRRHNNSLITHPCMFCDKGFHRRTELNNHIATVHRTESLTHPCHMCELKFSSSNSLYRHIRRNHTDDTDNTFKCWKCDKGFADTNELTDHMSISHGVPKRKKSKKKIHPLKKKFQCAHCEKRFSSIEQVDVHIKTSRKCTKIRERNISEFQCRFCNSKFPRKGDLNVHLNNSESCLTMRNAEIISEVSCKFCESFLGWGMSLQNHKTACLKQLETSSLVDSGYKCKFCSYVFIKFQQLVRHMKSSTKCLGSRGNKGVSCKICESVHSKNNACLRELKISAATDSGYKCRFCGQVYKKFVTLVRHMKSARICFNSRGNKDNESCKFCDNFVGAGILLRNHKTACRKELEISSVVDSGYKCRFCGKVWKEFRLLLRHIRADAKCLESRGNKGSGGIHTQEEVMESNCNIIIN